MPSGRQLRQTIAALKATERRCFTSRQRFGFYRYLAAVFKFYELLRRKNEARMSADRIAELFGIRTQKHTHSIRVIIEATSAADVKTKSRWCRALRFAWRERKRWKKFRAFLESNGGPAGCAAKFAALHPQHSRIPANAVRINGMDRVPTLPPLVAYAESLKPERFFVRNGKVFIRPDVMEALASGPIPTNDRGRQ